MKLYLIVILLQASVSFSLGQTLSCPAREKTKDFGCSLEKYGNKDQRDKKQPVFREKEEIKKENDAEIIRIETDLFVTNVLVTDQKGTVITNLKKDDFIVTENGIPQTIEVFSLGDNTFVPRSIVLVIDFYAMQAPYLKKSIEAAKLMVDKLSSQDKMAIVTTDVKLQIDFTKDKILLKKTLDSLDKYVTDNWNDFKSKTSGRTREFLNSLTMGKGATFGTGAEFDALLAVLNEMFTAEDRRPVIIFQGDGNEIIWLKPDSDAPYPISESTRTDSGMRYTGEKAMRNFGFSEVKEAVNSSRATIFSVAVGTRFLGFSKQEQKARSKLASENLLKTLGFNERDIPTLIRHFQHRDLEIHTAGQTAMSKIAELSGGDIGFIEKPEDAEKVYADIFTNIENRYVIGYYPTNQEQSGKSRSVKIEVRGHPEYTVTGRKSYLPQ